MKITYRDFDITATRIKKHSPIDFSVIRRYDGYEIAGGVEYEETTLSDFVEHLQGIVDNYHEDPTAYETDVDFQDDLPGEEYEFEEEPDEDAEPLEETED